MTEPAPVPDEESLAAMSRQQLTELGVELDGVELVEYGERYIPGSPADRRAGRRTGLWFALSGVMTVAFFAVFIWWPHEYQPPWSDTQWMYALFTPLIGATMGIGVLAFGIGTVSLAKRIVPHEVAVQQRHGGPSEPVDRQTVAAEVVDSAAKSGVKRRRILAGTFLTAGAGIAAMAALPVLGGLIKNPWADGADAPLWVTPWAPLPDGTKVRLVTEDGTPVRPTDMSPASMMTVFPGVPGGREAADAPVMLFRLRPSDVVRVRVGQQNFNVGDFYAYSKLCTHVGCPVSLYEQQAGKVLCPCHQSQFDINAGAVPVFGPATRPLPQLPIDLDAEGYFVARSDFVEAVGPGFWINGSYPPWNLEPKESAG